MAVRVSAYTRNGRRVSGYTRAGGGVREARKRAFGQARHWNQPMTRWTRMSPSRTQRSLRIAQSDLARRGDHLGAAAAFAARARHGSLVMAHSGTRHRKAGTLRVARPRTALRFAH